MAISARQSQLLEQRRALRGLSSFGGKRRILSPVSNNISSIAKKTAKAEVEAMIEKYNDGLISNEEMRSFLDRTVANPYLSPDEKVELENSIRDFDSRVLKDRLEASFRAAPENSTEQVQAAQALANYYTNRAAGMVAGTPAHSQATENAAVWDQKRTAIFQNMNTIARRNLRYQKEQEVNTLPTNSSQRASAKASMWQSLYEQAIADGDQTDAAKYASYYNQEITNAQELETREIEKFQKESAKEERDTIVGFLNQTINDYHDGKVTPQEFAQVLTEVDQWAATNSDVSLQLTVNKWSDKIAKDAIKGVKRGTIGNLPVVLGKGGGGGGGIKTNWDKEDFDYSDDLRLAKAMLDAGEWTADKYTEVLGQVLTDRIEQVNNRVETIYALASENPNQKITYNGKKQRVEDILENLYEEQASVEEQVQAYQGGNMAVLEVIPKEGVELGKGKSAVTYKLVDASSFDPGSVVADEQGILHELLPRKLYLTPEQMMSASNGYYVDANDYTISGQVKYDGERPYISLANQKVYRVYEPGTNKFQEADYQEGQTAKSFTSLKKEAEQALKAPKLEEAVKPKQEKNLVQRTLETGTGLVKSRVIEPRVEKAKEIVKPVANVVGKAIEKAIEPVRAQPAFKPEEQVKLNREIPVQVPEISLPQAPTQAPKVPAVQPKLEIVGAKEPNALQKLAQQPGFKPIQLGQDYGPGDLIKKAQQPSFEQKVWGGIKNLASKIWPFKR